MSVPTLKSMCLLNMAEMIKQLPPMLRDEIAGQTTENIRKEVKKKYKQTLTKKIMKETLDKSSYIIQDLVDTIIRVRQTGETYHKNDYNHWRNAEDDMFQRCVVIADSIVDRHQYGLLGGGYSVG